MYLSIEIDDALGAKLDALAHEEDRSRSAQARKLLRDAIEMAWTDELLFVEDETANEGGSDA